MNIVFLTEQNYLGKVDSDHPNMRTEYAWMNMLDAFHLPYQLLQNEEYSSIVDTADFFIMIPSKKNPQFLQAAHILKSKNKKFGIMQEGPNYLWQDWSIDNQIIYLGIIKQLADIMFVHNEKDAVYFKGITSKPVVVLKTVANIPAKINPSQHRNAVLIGGNMCSWYGGMNSYLAVRNCGVKEFSVVSMGRKQDKEEDFMISLDNRIKYLSYMPVSDFLNVLSEHLFVVHLMPTVAAGSLSLNSAMVGVPCIGNKDDDTQRILFPDLSIDVTDVATARSLAERLATDQVFYQQVVTTALNNLNQFNIDNNKQFYLNTIEKVING